MKDIFSRLSAKAIKGFIRDFDFIKLAEELSKGEPWTTYAGQGNLPAQVFYDQKDIARLAVDLAEKVLAEKGDAVDRKKLAEQADIISCQFDPELHFTLRGATLNLISHLFEAPSGRLFVSADSRELKHLPRLKEAQEKKQGVIYLINHTSHWDEIILNVFLEQCGLPMPLFAAGQNMMATPTLTKIFMVGSYVILRVGASRAYLATLASYCQALGEMGKPQGIFLEAWSGGARTRDGSLRYPRRLVALQGALNAQNDCLVQPVVISYNRVPEDLGLSEGKGLSSWINGSHWRWELFKRPWQPKKSFVRGMKNLYGRAYISFGEGRLVSELAAEQAEQGASDLTIDEFASLYAIREIARDKKIMATQIAARAVGRTKKYPALIDGAARAQEEIINYHQKTFGQDPDFEDIFHTHTLKEVLEDGLSSLSARKVISIPWNPLKRKTPKILAPHGLSYYATHGDRRLYSPSAKENFVVCGAGSWAYGLTHFLGRRTLGDKKYNNSSLTLYDGDSALMDTLAYERTTGFEFADYRLPKNIFPTHDHTAAFRKATEIIVAAPPHEIADRLKLILTEAKELRSLIIASRGFDSQTNRVTIQIAQEATLAANRSDINVLALNGPFSPVDLVSEESGGIWTLAGPVRTGRASEALLFKMATFKVQTSSDPIGVQMAAALADAYALYGIFLNRREKIRIQATAAASFLREVSVEAKALTLAMGGKSQTFEADNPAWLTEFMLRSMSEVGPNQAWLERLKDSGEASSAQSELAAQWPSPWSAGYFAIHSAYLLAQEFGLHLPHLEEAHRLFWAKA